MQVHMWMAHRVGPGEEASRGFSLSQSISKADLESQNTSVGVPFMAQQLTNPTRILMRTLVRSLVSLSGLRIRCCHELWCRLAAIARIRPLVWELPNAEGLALKRKKKKNTSVPSLTKSLAPKPQDMYHPRPHQQQPLGWGSQLLRRWGIIPLP